MSSVEVQSVRVELGSRSYDILIGQGLLDRAGELLSPMLARKRVFVVADRQVADLHRGALEAGLSKKGVTSDWVLVEPGEGSKSMVSLERVCDALIGAGCERDDLIVAFGGGVIGDLTGLAAGLLKRGARFVQIPTTLLAQVDSSVGGKTAVNSAAGKNLIGMFHQPSLVLADLDVLATLPARERAAGLAEVVKYGLIDDPEFLGFLEGAADKLSTGDVAALAEAVRVSCAAKARIVAADETEAGVRALLNFGHTFAHALERANGFSDTLLHGEAVGAGMALAMRYSVRRGLCAEADAERAEKVLRRMGLRTRIQDLAGGPYPPDELVAHMAHDKKAKQGRLTLVLSRGIGAAFISPDADADDLREFLAAEVEAAS